MKTGAPGGTRRVIADETYAVHQSLHQHPWISRLTLSSLDMQDYRTLLAAYYQFFSLVEQARQRNDAYDALSVGDCVAALQADLVSLDALPPASERELTFLDTKEKVLGSLYVMHGSGFGGRQMNINIQQVLPDMPRSYFEKSTDPAVWRRLNLELDIIGTDRAALEELIVASKKTFECFGEFTTRYCERFGQA